MAIIDEGDGRGGRARRRVTMKMKRGSGTESGAQRGPVRWAPTAVAAARVAAMAVAEMMTTEAAAMGMSAIEGGGGGCRSKYRTPDQTRGGAAGESGDADVTPLWRCVRRRRRLEWRRWRVSVVAMHTRLSGTQQPRACLPTGSSRPSPPSPTVNTPCPFVVHRRGRAALPGCGVWRRLNMR